MGISTRALLRASSKKGYNCDSKRKDNPLEPLARGERVKEHMYCGEEVSPGDNQGCPIRPLQGL